MRAPGNLAFGLTLLLVAGTSLGCPVSVDERRVPDVPDVGERADRSRPDLPRDTKQPATKDLPVMEKDAGHRWSECPAPEEGWTASLDGMWSMSVR